MTLRMPMKAALGAVLSCVLLATAQAGSFTFEAAGLKLKTSSDIRQLASKEVDTMYPPGRRPEFLLANPKRTVTISYDLHSEDISGLNLAAALPTFVRRFEKRVPGLVWKERKVIELAGQKWLQLEFLSGPTSADYHNMVFVTPVKDKMLVLNFNALASEFPVAQASLHAVIQSIQLNVPPTAEPVLRKPKPKQAPARKQ